MNVLRAVGREILGLFLDDEFLAVAALLVIGAVAIAVKVLHILPLLAGAALLMGCVTVLLLSVWRTAHAS